MKKSKNQQYSHCLYCLHATIVCIVPYVFWFSRILPEYGNYSNKRRI